MMENINWFNVLIDLYIIWWGFNYGKNQMTHRTTLREQFHFILITLKELVKVIKTQNK